MKDGPIDRLRTHWLRLAGLTLIAAAVVSQPVPATPQGAEQPSILVQIGAFRGPASAVGLAVEVEQRGFQAVVVPGDDYYRVAVGPFPNDAAATAAVAKLKAQGYDGYIRRDLVIPAPPEAPAPPAEPEPPPQPEPQQPAPPQATPEPAPAPEPVEPPPAPAQPVAPPPVQEAPPAVQPAPEPPPATPPEPPQPRQPEPEITTILPGAAEQPASTQPSAAPPAAQPSSIEELLKETSEPPTPEIAAAEPAQPGTPAIGRAPSTLRLLVLQGQDAINNIKQRTARDPVVQVTDENDRPIGGAAVTFALPSRGPSGVFANGARSVTVLTDSQGMATATGFAPNTVEGDMMMQVSASYQGQTASTVIAQANVAAGAGMSAATVGIIGAVVAGAAVGAVVALRGSDSSSPPGVTPPPRPSGTATVRPGGVTIGAP